MIKINRDDIGVLSLARQNKATIDLEGNVESISPYPKTREDQTTNPDSPRRSKDHRRNRRLTSRQQRGPDRRKGQRRQTDSPVILDTRNRYERRKQLRRNVDEYQLDDSDRPEHGFDDFA